jgi:uncharacterized membrane protein
MRHLLAALLLAVAAGAAQAQVEIDNGPSPPMGGTGTGALQGGQPLDTESFPEVIVVEEPIMVQENPNRVEEFLGQEGDFASFGAGPEGLEPYLDDAGRAALQASLTAYYQYRESGYVHRRAVFDWQLFSSKIIFYLVILLVLLGVYFSWLQFMAEHRKPAKREAVQVETGPVDSDKPRGGLLTTFKAGSGGLEVSSPVLGIVILAISLAFFYLYLTHVYPINEIF